MPYILYQADNITYTGLDISATMCAEAQRRNIEACELDQASFDLYDSRASRPENSHSTAYLPSTQYTFGRDTLGLLNELCRVLAPSGVAAIAFVQKKFMRTLPFTGYGFEFFDHQRVTELVEQSDFGSAEISDWADTVTNKYGETIERHYSIAAITKKT